VGGELRVAVVVRKSEPDSASAVVLEKADAQLRAFGPVRMGLSSSQAALATAGAALPVAAAARKSGPDWVCEAVSETEDGLPRAVAPVDMARAGPGSGSGMGDAALPLVAAACNRTSNPLPKFARLAGAPGRANRLETPAVSCNEDLPDGSGRVGETHGRNAVRSRASGALAVALAETPIFASLFSGEDSGRHYAAGPHTAVPEPAVSWPSWPSP
jgi:hypothetical protein